MKNYSIEEKYCINILSDSDGTQKKYYKDGFWYKIDNVGREGLAEELVSIVLSCSDYQDFVVYERCNINDKLGCRCKTFLENKEQFVSFKTLYDNYLNRNLAEDIRQFETTKERFEFLIQFIKGITNIDVTKYLKATFTLDMLIKNPDRHFGNLGIILKSDGTFKTAPIFDNGQGLYQNFQMTPPILEPEEKDARLFAATISGSFEQQVISTGVGLKINYEKLYEKLVLCPESIAKNCLYQQLKKYEYLLRFEEKQKETTLQNVEIVTDLQDNSSLLEEKE